MQIMKAAFPEYFKEGFFWSKELLEFMSRPVRVFWSCGWKLRSPTLVKWALHHEMVEEKKDKGKGKG